MEAMKEVVVGVDFSECSRAALAQAARLAALCGAKLRAVHVVEPAQLEEVAASLNHRVQEVEEKVVGHARFAMERMVGEIAAAAGAKLEVVVGPAAGELIRIGKESAAELLVMGTAGQGHPSGGVGTTAGKCVRHGPGRVLLVRPGQAGKFARIVACVDFSDTSRRALQEALRVARFDGATVYALHVFSPPPPAYPPGDMIGMWPIPAPDYSDLVRRLRESAEQALKEMVASLGQEARGVKVVAHVLEDTSYARGICHYARHAGADLVTIGTHGKTNLRYILLGSTAEKVLHDVGCSVLAVKPGAQAQ